MSLNIKTFKDKNGTIIKAGDVLIRRFFARFREHPGRRFVGSDMMGNEVIVNDEGQLKPPTTHFIKRRVMWSGACLIADRIESSNFHGAELFDDKGKPVFESAGFLYMNSSFPSIDYEIITDQ